MGVKSVINTDRLYWLGRYCERVYTTLNLFSKSFDMLIEQGPGNHSEFCRSLEIPDIYSDKDDFIGRYAFSADDPNSIFSNLLRAYDNAIELRDQIGSECLSYVQLAVYEMENAQKSDSPVLYFQKVKDVLLAFWGCVDDQIDDMNTRNILRTGKRVERLDLYARLKKERASLKREIARLTERIRHTDLIYSEDRLAKLTSLINEAEPDCAAIVCEVESILEQ